MPQRIGQRPAMSAMGSWVATCGTGPAGVSSQPQTKGQGRSPGRSPALPAGAQQDEAASAGGGGQQALASGGFSAPLRS